MLNSVFTATLKLLQFRAGPQDFPYSATLTRGIAAVAVAVAFVQGQLTLAVVPALIHAVLMLGTIAAVTWQLLVWRGLGSRAQQTINSLFATGIAFTVLLLPMLAAIAPHMVRIAEDPNRAAAEPVPALPFLAVIVLSLWNLGVSANIYRHALNLHFMMGVAISLMIALVSAVFAGSISGLFIN